MTIMLGRTSRSSLPKDLRQGRTGAYERPFIVDGRTYYISGIMRDDGKVERPVFILGAGKTIIQRFDENLYPDDVIAKFKRIREDARGVDVEVEHNLPKPVLIKSLRALAEREGIEDELLHSIAKSKRVSVNDDDHAHGEKIPEKWFQQLVDTMNRRFDTMLDTMCDNISAWMDAQFPSKDVKKARFTWQKKTNGIQPILTDEQIRQLRQLIQAHFNYLAGKENPDDRNLFETFGLVVPNAEVRSMLEEAFKAGRFYDLLKDGMTFEEARILLQRRQLSREMQLAMQMAMDMGGQYVQNLAVTFAATGETIVYSNNYRLIGSLVRDYIAGKLEVTYRNDDGLTPEESAQLVKHGDVVQGWKRLASELRNRFKTEELKRDWLRLALTESRWAANAGRLFGMEEDGVKYMYWLVQPTACDVCKDFYLYPDGTPKKFLVTDILDNFMLTGGMNYGRKKKDIGDGEKGWIITGGVIHPNDQCRPMAWIGDKYAHSLNKKKDDQG